MSDPTPLSTIGHLRDMELRVYPRRLGRATRRDRKGNRLIAQEQISHCRQGISRRWQSGLSAYHSVPAGGAVVGLLLVANDMEEVKVFIQEWPKDSWGIPQLGVDGLAGFKVNQAIETLRMQHVGLPSITHDLVGELRGVEMDTRRTQHSRQVHAR